VLISRAQAERAVNSAMVSTLAGYSQRLKDQYGLLYVNKTSEEIKADIEKYAKRILEPASGTDLFGYGVNITKMVPVTTGDQTSDLGNTDLLKAQIAEYTAASMPYAVVKNIYAADDYAEIEEVDKKIKSYVAIGDLYRVRERALAAKDDLYSKLDFLYTAFTGYKYGHKDSGERADIYLAKPFEESDFIGPNAARSPDPGLTDSLIPLGAMEERITWSSLFLERYMDNVGSIYDLLEEVKPILNNLAANYLDYTNKVSEYDSYIILNSSDLAEPLEQRFKQEISELQDTATLLYQPCVDYTSQIVNVYAQSICYSQLSADLFVIKTITPIIPVYSIFLSTASPFAEHYDLTFSLMDSMDSIEMDMSEELSFLVLNAGEVSVNPEEFFSSALSDIRTILNKCLLPLPSDAGAVSINDEKPAGLSTYPGKLLALCQGSVNLSDFTTSYGFFTTLFAAMEGADTTHNWFNCADIAYLLADQAAVYYSDEPDHSLMGKSIDYYAKSMFRSSANNTAKYNLELIDLMSATGREETELEYILTGEKNSESSAVVAKALVWGVRLAYHLCIAHSDTKVLTKAEAYAAAISQSYPAISAYHEAIKNAYVSIWAMRAAALEFEALLDGESVMLVPFIGTAMNSEFEYWMTDKTDYEDHLFLLLSLQEPTDKLHRIQNIISHNESPDILKNAIAAISVDASVTVTKLYFDWDTVRELLGSDVFEGKLGKGGYTYEFNWQQLY
jgi:hypothetical protein